MKYSDEQLETILADYLETRGIEQLLQIVFNCLMKSERSAYLRKQNNEKIKANGYRYALGRYGNKQFKLTIPRDRLGSFKPLILAILRANQEEMYDVAFQLYGEGLSQNGVGRVFEKIYGKKYSKSGISNMTSSFI